MKRARTLCNRDLLLVRAMVKISLQRHIRMNLVGEHGPLIDPQNFRFNRLSGRLKIEIVVDCRMPQGWLGSFAAISRLVLPGVIVDRAKNSHASVRDTGPFFCAMLSSLKPCRAQAGTQSAALRAIIGKSLAWKLSFVLSLPVAVATPLCGLFGKPSSTSLSEIYPVLHPLNRA